MKVQTTRFGEMEIEEDSVLRMAHGLIGFEECTRFLLLEHQPDSPFGWLQSLDRPEVALLVADPFQFFPDYELEVTTEDQKELGISTAEDLLVLTTVTVRTNPTTITTNLLGPLLVGLETRLAKQVILPGERYQTRHPINVVHQEAA